MCIVRCTAKLLKSSDHGRARTYNLRFRRPAIYPIELRGLVDDTFIPPPMNTQSRFFGLFGREKGENLAADAVVYMCIVVFEAVGCILGRAWAHSAANNNDSAVKR